MGFFSKKHSIGKTIAELRKEKGWTQIELAEKLQVSDKAISKWEKDSGAPSIEFFPTLAEVFGVSIDYLMTGKKVEPEIIIMSKIELCAKNDDVSMVNDINLTTKDENGKTLIDYIKKYNSYKVFTMVCDKIDWNKFGIEDFIKFSLITNNISVLNKTRYIGNNAKSSNVINEIKDLAHIDDLKTFLRGDYGGRCLITDDILDIIVLDKRVNNQTISLLLANQNKRNCVWYLVLPYLLHQSYLHNNIKLFDMVLKASVISNQYAYDYLHITYDYYKKANYEFKYFFIVPKHYGKAPHGLVRALEKTIKLALERSDIETVEKLNNLNTEVMKYHAGFKCYIATADEIRIAKLKLDKRISKNELAVQSTIHNGIVCIDELLQINDFETVKNTLKKYPIHIVELLYNMLKENRIRELFQKAIDMNDNKLAYAIANNKREDIIKQIVAYWESDINNKKYFYYYVDAKKVELFAQNYGTYYQKNIEIESAIEKLSNCKQRIIDDLSLRLDKEKTIGDLTKEYFEKELAKRNFDTIIIKLCIRLESILKNDYRYEGTFAEMLNKYCNAKLHWTGDDGWGYPTEECDSKTINILNKLRMKRNNIVHSEKNVVDLTLEELQYCIDYICKMG